MSLCLDTFNAIGPIGYLLLWFLVLRQFQLYLSVNGGQL